jgi:hypothetical protein
MLRRMLFAVAITGFMLSAGGAAHAAPPEHEKNIEKNATETFTDIVPCHPELGDYDITTTYNEQEHSTSTDDSSGHFTFTQTGTFSAVPSAGNTNTETFTGRFNVWGGGNFNSKQSEETFTFNVSGTGSQGTTFREHDNAHVVTDGPGDPEDPATPVKVAFDHDVCH